MPRSSSSETKTDPVGAVKEWAAAGDQLRSDLDQEIADLEKRLEDARAARALLGSGPDGAGGAAPARKDASGMSLPDAVVAAVAAKRVGASIADIRRWLNAHGKEYENKTLSTTLYRLQKSKALRGVGKRGAKKYRLPN